MIQLRGSKSSRKIQPGIPSAQAREVAQLATVRELAKREIRAVDAAVEELSKEARRDLEEPDPLADQGTGEMGELLRRQPCRRFPVGDRRERAVALARRGAGHVVTR